MFTRRLNIVLIFSLLGWSVVRRRRTVFVSRCRLDSQVAVLWLAAAAVVFELSCDWLQLLLCFLWPVEVISRSCNYLQRWKVALICPVRRTNRELRCVTRRVCSENENNMKVKHSKWREEAAERTDAAEWNSSAGRLSSDPPWALNPSVLRLKSGFCLRSQSTVFKTMCGFFSLRRMFCPLPWTLLILTLELKVPKIWRVHPLESTNINSQFHINPCVCFQIINRTCRSEENVFSRCFHMWCKVTHKSRRDYICTQMI